MKLVRLGVLVSGGGSNLQAIIDSCESGILKGRAEVAAVLSNRSDAYALERAKKHGIKTFYLDKKCFSNGAAMCGEIAVILKNCSVDIVCLAGYLSKLDPGLVSAFKGRIINIHPALLPKFGGKGMYGHHVHEAVLAAGEEESGATVHWVDEEYDHGKIIIQRSVPVLAGDTPDSVAKRVLGIEHEIYPEAILKVIREQESERARE